MSARESAKNAILNQLDLTFLSDRTLAEPSVYSAAVSSVCDLHCPHCMREAMGVKDNELMKLDDLERWGGEMRGARRILLYGLGEPFLNPKFFDFVALCKRLGLAVETTTHAMSLKPDVREKIVAAGIDEINISMDGATRETFERLRAGAIFETVLANVKALVALIKQRGATGPMLNIHMTVMRENLREVTTMLRLAREMGIRRVYFSSVVIYKKDDLAQNVADTPEFAATMQKARHLARRLGIAMDVFRQKPVGWKTEAHHAGAAHGCSQLWSNQIIEPDGRMKLCCYIEEDVANVWESGPSAAFNCDQLRRRRRALMEGKVRVECQGCQYLRERTPALIQSQLDEAQRQTQSNPNLTDEDRTELEKHITRLRHEKQTLWPHHGACHGVNA